MRPQEVFLPDLYSVSGSSSAGRMHGHRCVLKKYFFQTFTLFLEALLLGKDARTLMLPQEVFLPDLYSVSGSSSAGKGCTDTDASSRSISSRPLLCFWKLFCWEDAQTPMRPQEVFLPDLYSVSGSSSAGRMHGHRCVLKKYFFQTFTLFLEALLLGKDARTLMLPQEVFLPDLYSVSGSSSAGKGCTDTDASLRSISSRPLLCFWKLFCWEDARTLMLPQEVFLPDLYSVSGSSSAGRMHRH